MSFAINTRWTFSQFLQRIGSLAMIPAFISFVIVGLAELAPGAVSTGKVSGLLDNYYATELITLFGSVGFMSVMLTLAMDPDTRWFRFWKAVSLRALEVSLSLGSTLLGVGIGLLFVGFFSGMPDMLKFSALVGVVLLMLMAQFFIAKLVLEYDFSCVMDGSRKRFWLYQVGGVGFALYYAWTAWQIIAS